VWVEPDIRDEIIDYLGYWSKRAGFPVVKMLQIIGLRERKFYEWKERYGMPWEHNGKQPRDFWLSDEEKEAIIEYAKTHRTSGYRRMCYEMMDADVVAVSPSSVFRVLRDNNLMNRFPRPSPTKKGSGFEQPLLPKEHWHIDISYLNICGTFYYLCSILDGYSRKIIAWEIAETMTEAQVELIIERAKEQYPEARARIISDNGPQFIARDFKEYIKISGMTHVRTSRYYPQSNGKIERFHETLKNESIRQKVPLSLAEARKIVGEFIEEYNGKRLHSAIGWITPNDKMAGKAEEIWRGRDEKLELARKKRASGKKREKPHPEVSRKNLGCQNEGGKE
jgi:transposase InsO family protein